jgi:putative endonuclease
MRDEYIYYVYMMQSPSRRALYIGMTSNLRKRVWQHKNHIREGFSDDYNCTRLVYWESYDDVVLAINREKQLKRWRREKKLWLIERKNSRWQDLAADWYPAETQGPSTAHDLSKIERSCSARDDNSVCTTQHPGNSQALSSRAEENDSKNRSLESRDLVFARGSKR